MSSLRNAISRRAHKERSQPQSRKKFGLLEKHKDYVVRAKAYHKKEETLRRLREKAAFRNPDEFYFGMVKSRTVGGIHKIEGQANKYTEEELMLMKTQDMGYILQKLQSEKKKVEKLIAVLHSIDNHPSNRHTYYAEDRKVEFDYECVRPNIVKAFQKLLFKFSEWDEAKEIMSLVSEPRVGTAPADVPDNIKRKIAGSYRELEARKSRLSDLEKLYRDMALQKELQKNGRKHKLRDDEIKCPTSKPVYKWRAERKR